jgi:hypothetical protein
MVAFRRLDRVRRRLDHDAFTPSAVIERLVLQVIGGWENVKAEVNLRSFAAGGLRPDHASDPPATKMNRIATALRARHPHEEFSTVANDVNRVRQLFAHFLALGDTVGECPNRTLHFMRLGEPAESYRRRGAALGLS